MKKFMYASIWLVAEIGPRPAWRRAPIRSWALGPAADGRAADSARRGAPSSPSWAKSSPTAGRRGPGRRIESDGRPSFSEQQKPAEPAPPQNPNSFVSPPVGVYRQVCSGIPLAVRFVGKDRLLWNSKVQGTQRFRQVRAASCVIPYVLCGGLYCLRCWWSFGGGPCPPLYIRGNRVTWRVLAEYSWNSTTT